MVVLGVVAVAAIALFGRGSLFLRWSDLDRGTALRRFCAVLIVVLIWRFTTADFDYVYGQWRSLDRIGLGLAGALALWRPIALVPFVVQARLLQTPLRAGFDFALGTTLDDLPIVILMAVAAIVLLAAATGSRTTYVVVSLMASATAIEFFTSGRRKLGVDWLADNDLANFPLNGYYQGWLGSTDGAVAEFLSGFLDRFRWPLLVGTLVLELGAIVSVTRRRWLLFALAVWPTFHLVVFFAYGFSFIEWAIVEIGFLALLAQARGREWSKPAFRLVPVALSVLFVFYGGVVFKPPALVWLDGPITYAYEVDAVDEEGNARLMVANDFSPHESAFAFGFLHLGPSKPVAAGYGALNRAHFEALQPVHGWSDLEKIEDPVPVDDPRRDQVVANIEQFLLHSGRPRALVDRIPDAPTRYSTSRSGQNYEPGTTLSSLLFTRVTVLRVDGEVLERRERVVQFVVADDGVEVEWFAAPR